MFLREILQGTVELANCRLRIRLSQYSVRRTGHLEFAEKHFVVDWMCAIKQLDHAESGPVTKVLGSYAHCSFEKTRDILVKHQ